MSKHRLSGERSEINISIYLESHFFHSFHRDWTRADTVRPYLTIKYKGKGFFTIW